MTIQFAILGYLSWQPLSGYDLKKLFASSTALYWSGNSNQIYRALVQLHADGLVTYQVQAQEDLPAKKIYSLTAAGREALLAWLRSPPPLPEMRNPFLAQLAWADLLPADELDCLLANYESELQARLQMEAEQARRGPAGPQRTPREALLWQAISENMAASYRAQLAWVRQLRDDLQSASVDAGTAGKRSYP